MGSLKIKSKKEGEKHDNKRNYEFMCNFLNLSGHADGRSSNLVWMLPVVRRWNRPCSIRDWHQYFGGLLCLPCRIDWSVSVLYKMPETPRQKSQRGEAEPSPSQLPAGSG